MIVHLKRHVSSPAQLEFGEGFLKYGKDGYLYFQNYNVPDNFDLEDTSNRAALVLMYMSGSVKSACGTINHIPFTKDNRKQL
jgi:hypothetical protein